MIAFERRASAILHNLLRARSDARPLLVPANVCPIVAVTLLEADQPFELVDIEEPWLTIDRRECVERLRGRAGGYAGLIFVRPYGSERDPTPFFAELRAAQHDLLVIDDKCLCRPDCDGVCLSPLADVTLFSTGYAKYVDAGGGGFAHVHDSLPYRPGRGAFGPQALEVVTRQYERALATRTAFGEPAAGWLDLGEPTASWGDYRGRTIEAANRADTHRQRLNTIYAHALPPEIQLSAEFQAWRFNIRVPAPALLLASIAAVGLFASRHYASLGGIFGTGTFPVAERLQAQVVNLFHDRHFDEGRARRVADLVLRHLEISRPQHGRDVASADPAAETLFPL